MNAPDPKDKPLRIHFPGWNAHETVLGRNEPFALWLIGDQPLLYHWLDHAVNQRYSKVIVYTTDHPAEIRQAMAAATLWPIEWKVVPSEPREEDEKTVEVRGLPWKNAFDGEEAPSGWALLDHWFSQEKAWYESAFGQNEEVPDVNLAIGRNCNIHPSAKLHMPVYIGNNVQIGEGCEIGPYASVGSDCMLAGYNRVHHSKIEPRTFLGPQTELDTCYLSGGLLANLRHRALLPKVESFVADSWSRGVETAGISERALAVVMWGVLALRTLFLRRWGKRRSLATFQGLILTTFVDAPLWRKRMPWLLEVARGRCRLIGVLPRTQQQFAALTEEWQEILAAAPVGVFSYADSHGCHDAEDEMEAVHAVFQATTESCADQSLGAVCRRFAWRTVFGRTP